MHRLCPTYNYSSIPKGCQTSAAGDLPLSFACVILFSPKDDSFLFELWGLWGKELGGELMEKVIERILISEEVLDRRVLELGQAISADYAGKDLV